MCRENAAVRLRTCDHVQPWLPCCSPYGSLETRGPDEDRLMNDSNGSLIAVRCLAGRCLLCAGASRQPGGSAAWTSASCSPLLLASVRSTSTIGSNTP